MLKKVLYVLMAGILVLMTLSSAVALDISTDAQTGIFQEYYDAIDEYLEDISALDDTYACCAGSTYSFAGRLYNHSLTAVTSLLFKIEKNGQYLGYVIVRTADPIVLESALCEIPYKLPDSGAYTPENVKWVYDFANHGVSVDGQTPVYITDSEVQQSVKECYFNFGAQTQTQVSPQTVLSKVPVYRQEGNCIVCAVSHLLLYWNNNGFSGLTPTVNTQAKFEALMSTVDEYFPQYANNNIPLAMAQYASDRSTPLIDGNVFYVFGTNDWSPTYDKIKDEIAAGRPLLLGFAPAETGSYDDVEGHMTLCVGAASTYAELNYVQVVDGHSSSIVMKYWNEDVNDFICKVTVEQKTMLP